MALRPGIMRPPAARSGGAPGHAGSPAAPAAGSAARGSAGGEIGEAAGEALAAAASGAARGSSGGLARGLMRTVSQGLGWPLVKTGLQIFAAYELMKGLVGFKNDIVNGTPFHTGGAVPADRMAAAAAGSNRSMPSGTVAVAAATPPTPIIDPRIERSMATVAGREALDASQRVDAALDGKTEANRLAYADGRSPVAGPERPVLDANRAALGPNDNASFVRLTVPGGNGRTVDFLPKNAVNDRAALDEFKEAYPRLARDNGLPAELPPGAAVMVGRPPEISAFGEPWQKSQPREYRYVQDATFQRNPRFEGSMDVPGSHSFATGIGYQDGSRRFDLAEIRQGDPNLVRAARVEDQARESSLIVHREPYVGSLGDTVSAPVSTMDKFLGRSAGSGLDDLARGISDGPRLAMQVQSVDLATQQRGVGVVGKYGSAMLGTGPAGDFVSVAHRGTDGLVTNIQVSGEKGAFGNFAPDGRFAGTDAVTRAMSNASVALENRADSPVLSALRDAGVRGEKDLNLDLTPGKESAVTRVHYGDRVVDYAARNGQMTMIERDPETNVVREAAMIRSRDIQVDAQGHLSMDPASRAVLNDHVKTYAAGRSGQEFAQTHPMEASQFASLRDAGLGQGANVALAQAGGRAGAPEVETTGTASVVRAAGLRESATPVTLAETATPGAARAAASRGLGD